MKFKGRFYCWVGLREHGEMILPPNTLDTYAIKPGDYLLTIRGSDIAFDFAVKGPIIEKAKLHPEIEVFEI